MSGIFHQHKKEERKENQHAAPEAAPKLLMNDFVCKAASYPGTHATQF